jgi:D-amino peptidase
MKILIMTDMEGVAGVLNFEDWTRPEGRYYEKGKRLLTAEVNAAIRGFCNHGVTEIRVVDGHGPGAIDPEQLDPRVELMRGRPRPNWPWTLDESFDALAFVGQHAKAGTPHSHLTHTQYCRFIDLSINGISIGEYGQLAFCAMELGVPTILAGGENALAEEAQKLTPGVVAVGVKQGILPDGLEELSMEEYRQAKLAAIHKSPGTARELIEEGAAEAIRRFHTAPGSFRYPDLTPPYVREARFRPAGDDPGFTTRNEHPDSIIALMNEPYGKPNEQ